MMMRRVLVSIGLWPSFKEVKVTKDVRARPLLHRTMRCLPESEPGARHRMKVQATCRRWRAKNRVEHPMWMPNVGRE